MLAELALVGHKIFHGSNLIAVHQKQTNVVLNKPIYVRASILDLSKYFMYNFYNHIKRKYGDRAKLCYTDTDSLIIKIETEDVYADMIEDADLYDFSDYPEEHPLLEKLPADQWRVKSQRAPPDSVIRGRPERYVPERIIKHRTRKGQLQYLVKWERYPEDESTWEPADRLQEDIPNLVRIYNDTK
ncbi:hypothetical protein RclHR1_32310003 [Rhizophagus clarus]|uniref:Chromo domain-containing protein n=1 Tax=Rhizophagus clarus TaxID=94130 RepID=A0A2Z6RBT0_9GLOM|nr:hypothetical protein RclHR1_32310003 [Rhizophagus clarus]